VKFESPGFKKAGGRARAGKPARARALWGRRPGAAGYHGCSGPEQESMEG